MASHRGMIVPFESPSGPHHPTRLGWTTQVEKMGASLKNLKKLDSAHTNARTAGNVKVGKCLLKVFLGGRTAELGPVHLMT